MPCLRRIAAPLLLSVIVFATPLMAQQQPQQKKQQQGKKREATPNEYALLGQYREVQAKIVSTDPTNQQATIEIDVPHLERSATMRSSRGKGKKGKGSRPSFKVEVDHLDFTLPLVSNAPIRKMNLPVEYDERGNLKELSSLEKLQLKGKSDLPGYAATLQDLKAGTTVKAQLLAPKSGSAVGSKPQIKTLIAIAPPPDTSTKTVPMKKKK